MHVISEMSDPPKKDIRAARVENVHFTLERAKLGSYPIQTPYSPNEVRITPQNTLWGEEASGS